MKNLQLISLFSLFVLSTSCAKIENKETLIVWDTWGVPHITADNVEELFYAQGWAQMHNHANLILDLYGSSRGKGAEYWGEDKLQNDILIHTLGFPELANQWEVEKYLDPETKIIYEAFISGMNDYAKAYPEAIGDRVKMVLPLTTRDIVMHGMYVVFTRFVGGKDLGRVQQWPDLGSNAYAIAPKRTASGNAMLVQNPHLPWWGEFLYFESHLNFNGKNMYGVNLIGLPGITMGFNDHLGWAQTNNTLDNADSYELEIDVGGYLLDGNRRDFETSSTTIKIKQEDGSLVDHELQIQRTVHGPVVNKTEDKAVAIRMAGLDVSDLLLQYWRMINSTNFTEFEDALKMAQMPFWNVIYADKQGEIFYLFNGLVPKRNAGDWAYWDRIIPGGKSADIWTEMHAYEDLPKLKNPASGWIQNANDPPWTSTIPMSLNPDDYPAYMSPRSMYFRPQRSARMILEDSLITYDKLVAYKLSTRLEFADRILDDLFLAIDNSSSEKAKAAKVVLENWDRSADADSKGMVLFYNWAQKFNVWEDSNYEKGWDMANPYTTPYGLADPARAVQLLELAATEVESKFGSLEVRWGDYYRISYNGKDLPANGVDGSLGAYRVTWPGRLNEDQLYVVGGDSWVSVIEFGDEVRAKVLLSYGNATQKDSPHNGDQLELFSKKELRDAWITPAEIESNTARVEVLTDKGFQIKER